MPEVSLVEIVLRWMSLDLIDDKSTFVQVMAWCRQATSHYLSQYWPISLSPFGVTRPQWVKNLWHTRADIKFWILLAHIKIFITSFKIPNWNFNISVPSGPYKYHALVTHCYWLLCRNIFLKIQGPVSKAPFTKWINFNPSMGKYLHPLQSAGWNYLSATKLIHCNCWSLEMDNQK